MDVEVVQLIGLVLDGPRLHRPEPDPGVDPVRIEGLAVDIENIPALDLPSRKDDRALPSDLSPEIGDRQERPWQRARRLRFTRHPHRDELGTGILIS